MANLPAFPTTLPGGTLLPYMDAQHVRQIATGVFEMLGGAERLHHEANRNPETYRWFVEKVWVKTTPKRVLNDNAKGSGFDEFVDRLDELERERKAKTIEARAREIPDASEAQHE